MQKPIYNHVSGLLDPAEETTAPKVSGLPLPPPAIYCLLFASTLSPSRLQPRLSPVYMQLLNTSSKELYV